MCVHIHPVTAVISQGRGRAREHVERLVADQILGVLETACLEICYFGLFRLGFASVLMTDVCVT